MKRPRRGLFALHAVGFHRIDLIENNPSIGSGVIMQEPCCATHESMLSSCDEELLFQIQCSVARQPIFYPAFYFRDTTQCAVLA